MEKHYNYFITQRIYIYFIQYHSININIQKNDLFVILTDKILSQKFGITFQVTTIIF